MSRIIDNRENTHKSAVNRQRFLERYRKQIQEAVNNAVNQRSITEMDKGEKINIPAKDLSEPIFSHGHGGVIERIFPGNKNFASGDTVQRPPNDSAGQGSQASDTGSGEDSFVFELSREEFLEMYFDHLELPNMVKKELATIENYKYVRAGITTTGTPTNINVIRSMRQATGRRVAFAGPHKKKLHELQQQLDEIKANGNDEARIAAVLAEIEVLHRKIDNIPFIDKIDLRYNHRVKQLSPCTQAVMFCLMDVSGSMDEAKKDIAKRFFILLYLFLNRNYKKIDLVFIRHHTSAKEVTEEEFFYSRETGGTVVSSALELTLSILLSRYPSNNWNIYIAQASDGDNWNADSPYCQELLLKILPLAQYYAYVEITPRHHQSLWESYQTIAEKKKNFSMQTIYKINEIYPVFCELFKKKTTS